MTDQQRQHAIRWGVIAARLIIGALFVISGMAKDIDLWGTVYKIEEYLHVWGITQPRTIVFMGALCLSGAEFILGALLLLGCCRRWVPILLAVMMAFMLPLTLYIYISNPVSDCGCFGDFLVLSNAATFWKNVLITAAVVFLLKYNRSVMPYFNPYSQWIVITLLSAYLLAVGLYGYNIQPMIDFRSFPVGSSLLPDEDSSEDDESTDDIVFIYEKDGKQSEFSLDALPDSTWTFVDRIDRSPSTDSRTELTVYDLDGNDATAEAISGEGEEMILVIPQLQRAEVSWTYFLNEMSEFMARRGGMMVALVGGDASVEAWADLSMASYPIYTAEATTLKELARGNMALVYAKDGKVVWKRSMALMDTSVTDAMLFDSEKPETFVTGGTSFFKGLTATMLVALFALYLLDSTGRIVKWRIARRRALRKPKAD